MYCIYLKHIIYVLQSSCNDCIYKWTLYIGITNQHSCDYICNTDTIVTNVANVFYYINII